MAKLSAVALMLSISSAALKSNNWVELLLVHITQIYLYRTHTTATQSTVTQVPKELSTPTDTDKSV